MVGQAREKQKGSRGDQAGWVLRGVECTTRRVEKKQKKTGIDNLKLLLENAVQALRQGAQSKYDTSDG